MAELLAARDVIKESPIRYQGGQHMKTGTILAAFATIAAAPTALAADQPAAAPHVAEVITLDVGANMEKFSELTKRVDAIAKKLQTTGTVRYYVSTWAGTAAGHVIVTVEYPSLASLAQSVAKFN